MLAKLSLAAGLVLAAATLAPIGASAAGSPIAAVRRDRRRRLAGAEGPVLRSLPRVAPRVRGALGLAYARSYFRCVERRGC